MEQKFTPEELIKKYLNGTCTEHEKAIIESWHLDELSDSTFVPSVERIELAHSTGRPAIVNYAKSGFISRKLLIRIAAAASLVFCIGIVGYFFAAQYDKKVSPINKFSDVGPGGNNAVLTLANGHQIVLNGIKKGMIALQGNIHINKIIDGNLAYQSDSSKIKNGSEIEFNYLSTPLGGQYQLSLADGTKVWLNSASSIRFPVNFSNKERRVEVTGEVYFEVAHNARNPFKVLSNGQTVEVLGTHFNINSYPEEGGTKTTLLEGSVKVSAGKNSIIIKPGQQSVIQGDRIVIHDDADLDEVVAWKNGYFRFNDEKIESIMRKLSRWYNIDVRYQGNITSEGFSGAISRSKNISQVLKMLEKTEAVHFKIEGRRVIID